MYSSVHLCTTVCIYVQQCASMHNSVYLCTAVCIYAQQCVSMYSSVYLCTTVCIYVQRVYVCTAVCIYVQQCASMHNSVYLCTAVCIYVWQWCSTFLSRMSHNTVLKSLQARPMQNVIIINNTAHMNCISYYIELSDVF